LILLVSRGSWVSAIHLANHALVVSLIGSTRTQTGLHIQAELDTKEYQQGIKISDEELESVRLKRDKFRGDWNYTIEPRPE
jgi:hypothetical protein